MKKKDGTEITLKISSNVLGDFNSWNNNLNKLLLTNTQVSKFCKAFANVIEQSGENLGKIVGPILKTALPLIWNILKPLGKCGLIPLGLTLIWH